MTQYKNGKKLFVESIKLTCLIACSLAIISLCGLAAFTVSTGQDPFPSTVTLISYDKSTILSVCQLFNLRTDDAFCADAGHQNVFSLKALLIRLFPPGKATYNDIMPFIQHLPSGPSYTCREAFETSADGFCPQPQSCQADYYCTVTFPGNVRTVDIDFNHSTGVIEGFGVTNTQGGSQ